MHQYWNLLTLICYSLWTLMFSSAPRSRVNFLVLLPFFLCYPLIMIIIFKLTISRYFQNNILKYLHNMIWFLFVTKLPKYLNNMDNIINPSITFTFIYIQPNIKLDDSRTQIRILGWFRQIINKLRPRVMASPCMFILWNIKCEQCNKMWK